MFHLRRTCCLS